MSKSLPDSLPATLPGPENLLSWIPASKFSDADVMDVVPTEPGDIAIVIDNRMKWVPSKVKAYCDLVTNKQIEYLRLVSLVNDVFVQLDAGSNPELVKALWEETTTVKQAFTSIAKAVIIYLNQRYDLELDFDKIYPN